MRRLRVPLAVVAFLASAASAPGTAARRCGWLGARFVSGRISIVTRERALDVIVIAGLASHCDVGRRGRPARRSLPSAPAYT
jgi:hypothetical protein